MNLESKLVVTGLTSKESKEGQAKGLLELVDEDLIEKLIDVNLPVVIKDLMNWLEEEKIDFDLTLGEPRRESNNIGKSGTITVNDFLTPEQVTNYKRILEGSNEQRFRHDFLLN